MITIGIDPGWSTFGIAITEDGKLVDKTSFKPKEAGSRSLFISNYLDSWITSTLEECSSCNKLTTLNITVYIERFVAYSGVQVSASEDILMLIGALEYYFEEIHRIECKLVKAIDWKVKLCQHLVKTKGFSNPRKNLDKKFSLTAAGLLSGREFKSDHEADAVCLSYLKDDILKVKK